MRKSILLALSALYILLIVGAIAIGPVLYSEAQGSALIFPTAFKGVREAGPDNRWVTVDLDYASFIANLWNLAGGAQGFMRMEFTGKSAEVYGEFSNLPNQVVIQGGPGIRYGRNIWGGNPPAHPLYKIPKKLTELPYAMFFANYTVYEEESTLPITVTLFLWTVEAIRDGGTKAGDVLIIVRLYRHPGAPLTGTILANVTAPLIIDGALVYAPFAVQAGNLDRSADTQTTITFELLTPIKSGRVGVPIQEFVALASTLLPQLAPDVWTSDMVLDNTMQMIDFSFEWYSNEAGEGKFKWSLYEVSFLVGANVIETTKTVTKATTITTIEPTTVTTVEPTTVTITSVPPPVTVTSIEPQPPVTVTTVAPTTITSVPPPVTVTSVSTLPVTETITETTKVREVDWSTTAVVGVVLLLVGLGIGMVLKPRVLK
uniref:Uncharacterized protein n=1 Tax=Ignisphaera aggregans TaxID=334771 RepID=A0A7C4BDW4_9CREN